MYIHIHVYTCIYMCIYMYIYIYIYTYISIYCIAHSYMSAHNLHPSVFIHLNAAQQPPPQHWLL